MTRKVKHIASQRVAEGSAEVEEQVSVKDLIGAIFALACAWLDPASPSWRSIVFPAAFPAGSENEPAALAQAFASAQVPEPVQAAASLQVVTSSREGELAQLPQEAAPSQTHATPSREELACAYNNLLSIGGSGGPAALPVESLYRPWTEDAQCHLPFRSEKGYVGGDSMLHLRFILQELGVDASQLEGLQPDHLAVELNVLGLLLEEDISAAQRFAQDHLTWVDAFRQTAQKRWATAPESAYYVKLIDATRMCVQTCMQVHARMCTEAHDRMCTQTCANAL